MYKHDRQATISLLQEYGTELITLVTVGNEVGRSLPMSARITLAQFVMASNTAGLVRLALYLRMQLIVQ
jgi:hypothetical protein